LRVEKVNSAASYAPDQLTKIRQVNPTALHRGTNRFMQAELAGKDAEEVSSQSGPDATKNMSGATAVPPAVENGEVLDWAGTAIKFNQVIVVTATAYCPGTPESGCPLNSQGRSLCTDWYNDGYTYTGKKAVQGEGTLDSPRIVAVDPRIIPLSSKIYLEGIGFAVAEDIGGSIQGNRIDILFNLHQDALKFGLRKGIKLYVLAGTG
ncbi:MAG TPA: hypothetical protein GX693_04905, partial [Firmicutes bacterium]|nr:hypothetical protein [Bacillota bacterium]